MRASSCRKAPAAALRGLTNSRPPASRCRALIASKSAWNIRTSPRTSISAGGFVVARRSGSDAIVRAFGVTSSPTMPSPRVAARVSTPSS